ncbi:MAG TPA: OmpH family outer membrane protein [Bacteroidales bacterium]|nr:hypothetical protein [Bacteroidales bacterium]HOU95897.1 OmpH family outer membrane protein [Bacteroidales bacterium]HQG35874.1 OmpH family outer membrane protein [Bacteroidales bacterium]HQG52384.1 OmpH family outer membrane protein [Bacteroidales bacterium]HQJ20117.1 OmpH family outer membrane protein [Bacteroidales bacterium]
MRKILLITTVFVIFSIPGLKVEAQALKFGHINTDELIRAMPEYDSAMAKLTRIQKELINELELMQVELNNKYETYNRESKNYTELVRQTKEQELADMSKRIQDFQLQAQNQLQEEQTNLTRPIFEKVDKAIRDVGKEGGFIYVFDATQLRYFDETKSVNVMPQVKAKLGIK